MKRGVLVGICIVTFASSVAFADEASHKKTALELLEITNARSTTDQIIKSFETMIR